MKTLRSLISAAFLLVVSFPASWTADPPSDKTPDEVMWRKLGASARENLLSDKTRDLAKAFLSSYPRHLRAPNARYILAEASFKKEDYMPAATAFEKFLSDYPENPLADSAAFRLGECYYNLKTYTSAQTAWGNMLRRYPKSALAPEALENLSIIYMRGGEWGKSDEILKRLGESYGDFSLHRSVREKMGATLYYQKEFVDSAKVLEGVDGAMAAYYRGFSLFSLKLYDDTVAVLKSVEGQATGPYAESAAYLRAEGFFQKKNFNLAAGEFKSFLAKYPQTNFSNQAKLRVAASSLFLNDPEEALQGANQVLKGSLTPSEKIHGIFIKGAAALALKDYTAASEQFAKVAVADGYPDLAAAALVRRAWADKNLGNDAAFQRTIMTLEQKYPTGSPMALGHYLLGAFYFEKQKYAEAGNRFETALLRHPYSILSEAEMALMAVSYTRSKQWDQLLTSANSAFRIIEGNYSSPTPYWRGQANYFIGRAYYETQKYRQALPYLEKVTTDFSDHPLAPHAQLLLAQCLIETRDYAKAREKADVLAENPKTDKRLQVPARFLKSVSYFNAKDYDKALADLADFIKGNPKHDLTPHALYMMGLAYHQKKTYGSAIEEWDRLIVQFPSHPLSKDAYLQIADLYFKAPKYPEAAKYFNGYQKKWPANEFAELALWKEIQCYFNSKNDETAIASLPIYLKKYPEGEYVDDAKKQLEIVYYRRGAEGDPAKLEQFLGLYPKSPFAPSARYKLGDMAMEQKKFNRATVEFEQFLRDFPSDNLATEAHYALGQAYEQLSQPEKAVMQYDVLMKSFASKPASLDAAFRLGMLHFQKDRYKEALEAFLFASKKKMNKDVKANLNYNIALCYENLGQPESAAAYYQNFAVDASNRDQARESLMTAGLLLKKAEKFSKAAQAFEILLKEPTLPAETAIQAVNLQAESYNADKNVSSAIKTYEKLTGMEPSSNEARLAGLAQLAFLYEQKKQVDKAIRIYEVISVSEGKSEWVKAAREKADALNKSLNSVP